MKPLVPPAIRLGLAVLLIPASRTDSAQTNALSLAAAYPPEALEAILIPRETWRPFPAWNDRDAWGKVPTEARRLLIAQGESALETPMPVLPATLYLAYAREGDRARYEGPYFDRRRRLHQLVLAECAEGQGRFHDAIADTLWALCEESSWCIPAHVGGQKAGVGLPDVTEPILDLFAAQTGASVAWTLYLAGEPLDRVSPVIRRRAVAELNARVLTPYRDRDFGWMGFGASTRQERPNNWNPWINGNVLTAILLQEDDPARRVALTHRVLRSLDRFLQPHPADGGCDEGPGYWSRAGGSVLDNLDLLFSATDGRLDVFANPLIREIGRFIHRVHLGGDWVVNLGDCAARAGFERDVVFRYGRRIGDPDLLALATSGATLDDVLRSAAGTDLGRGLSAVFNAEAIVRDAAASPPLVRDVWLGSDDLQMMVARDRGGTTRGLTVAAWGGHNAQSHNHNDVGQFLVIADGHPLLIDLGAPTYTARTFSRQRYEIPAMQSDWHNLPTINGRMQEAGRAFAARDVVHRATDAFAEVSMDLAGAWPAEAGVRAWRRTVRLDRGAALTLTEVFELTTLDPGATLNLIAAIPPRPEADGTLVFPLPAEPQGPSRIATLEFDASHLAATVEPFDLNDGRLARSWGHRLHRIRIQARAPALSDTWIVRLRLRATD